MAIPHWDYRELIGIDLKQGSLLHDLVTTFQPGLPKAVLRCMHVMFLEFIKPCLVQLAFIEPCVLLSQNLK